MPRPFYIYDNWSAYDELSDNVQLTEGLAMRQFEEVCRLRKCGLKIDAYLMDAFWYAPDGGYIEWRKEGWPKGPDAWLAACEREGILPGLWFTANTLFHLEPPEAWRNSVASDGWGLSCSQGGFLAGLVGVLDHWYGRGVRVFKFDFADFGAIPTRAGQDSKVDARRDNIEAFRSGLGEFQERHSDIVLLAYNGFEHTEFMPWTDRPVRPVLERTWLDVFDTVYCGDPRPADLPLPNFWRSVDVYADAMVHLLHRGSGLALNEIDNCAFMIGKCGTCYRRGAEEWKTTALLSYARGGRVHVTMGNLEALTDGDAEWLAQVQRLYDEAGPPAWVGGNPGQSELYAYAANGTLTAINPSLEVKTVVAGTGYNLSFSDGFAAYDGETLTLGPGSVAVLAVGQELGGSIGGSPNLAPIEVEWQTFKDGLSGTVNAPVGSDLHLVFRQKDAMGLAVRTSGGSPPDGASSAALLRIEVHQGDRQIPVERPDDKVIWSGMSWAYGVVRTEAVRHGEKLQVRFTTGESLAVHFQALALVERGK